jgi:phospholipase/carboxylesterase
MVNIFALSGPEIAPANGGPARQLVVLLHGLGADGQDLIGLAPPLSGGFPDAAFVAPNAPFPCDMAPFGYQWFSVLDRTPEIVLAGVRAAAPALDGFIDEQLRKHDLDDENLVLFGFSQGTMMALHVGLRRARPCAGIVGHSGRLVAVDRLPDEISARPPVLLIHGDADEVVSISSMPAAAEGLRAADIEVETHVCHGLGHGINEDGLRTTVGFLQRILNRGTGS